MTYHVYILYSSTVNKYYVGQTDNIERRLTEHNTGQTRFTTQKASDWELKYSEGFATRSEAVTREKEIKKKKSRKYIEWLSTKG